MPRFFKLILFIFPRLTHFNSWKETTKFPVFKISNHRVLSASFKRQKINKWASVKERTVSFFILIFGLILEPPLQQQHDSFTVLPSGSQGLSPTPNGGSRDGLKVSPIWQARCHRLLNLVQLRCSQTVHAEVVLLYINA